MTSRTTAFWGLALALVAGRGSVLAAAHSDFTKHGWPMFHRGVRGTWWGWPAGYDVWAVPYTESTIIVDVIDAHTNQLVWRGYDSDTLNTKDPDKALSKAVDSVLARFYHDAKEHRG